MKLGRCYIFKNNKNMEIENQIESEIPEYQSDRPVTFTPSPNPRFNYRSYESVTSCLATQSLYFSDDYTKDMFDDAVRRADCASHAVHPIDTINGRKQIGEIMSKFRDQLVIQARADEKKEFEATRVEIEQRLGHVITSCSMGGKRSGKCEYTCGTCGHNQSSFLHHLQKSTATNRCNNCCNWPDYDDVCTDFFNNKNFTMVTTRHEFLTLYRTKKCQEPVKITVKCKCEKEGVFTAAINLLNNGSIGGCSLCTASRRASTILEQSAQNNTISESRKKSLEIAQVQSHEKRFEMLHNEIKERTGHVLTSCHFGGVTPSKCEYTCGLCGAENQSSFLNHIKTNRCGVCRNWPDYDDVCADFRETNKFTMAMTREEFITAYRNKDYQVSAQITVRCKCGELFTARMNNLKSGNTSQCNECAGKHRSETIMENHGKRFIGVREEIKERLGHVITSYQQAGPDKGRCTYTCGNCGQEGRSTHLSHLRQSTSTNKCVGCNLWPEYDDVYDYFEKNSTFKLTMTREEFITAYRLTKPQVAPKITVQCMCGNIMQARINNLKSGNTSQCDECAYERRVWTTNDYTYKSMILPSGRIIKCLQGFEPDALLYLFGGMYVCGFDPTIVFCEENLLLGRRDVGCVPYTFQGESHNYYPDFQIVGTNIFIEVKSMFTLLSVLGENLAKFTAVCRIGSRLVIMVIDEKQDVHFAELDNTNIDEYVDKMTKMREHLRGLRKVRPSSTNEFRELYNSL